MKRSLGMAILMLSVYAIVLAQQPQVPPAQDPNAPTLTLQEKITLTTDEIKKQDVVERLQKEYMEAIRPINDHEEAAKEAIEKDHPGWVLENGPQGFHFTKKTEPKATPPANPTKAPEAPKK